VKVCQRAATRCGRDISRLRAYPNRSNSLEQVTTVSFESVQNSTVLSRPEEHPITYKDESHCGTLPEWSRYMEVALDQDNKEQQTAETGVKQENRLARGAEQLHKLERLGTDRNSTKN
jgi:hypothetical protein